LISVFTLTPSFPWGFDRLVAVPAETNNNIL
jgi:hypothetical protein